MQLNRASLRPLADISYDCYLGLGQIAYVKGQTKEAIGYFERAIRLHPTRPAAYHFLGSVFFPRGDSTKAAESFVQAVRMNPYDLTGRFYLGTCWMKLGKYRAAAEQFRAAREVDPTYWEAHEAEARALDAAGDSAGATRVRTLLRSP